MVSNCDSHLGVLGDTSLGTLHLDAARDAYVESDRIARALEEDYGIATSDARFALLASAEGDAATVESRAHSAAHGMAGIGGTLAPWLASRLREVCEVPASSL